MIQKRQMKKSKLIVKRRKNPANKSKKVKETWIYEGGNEPTPDNIKISVKGKRKPKLEKQESVLCKNARILEKAILDEEWKIIQKKIDITIPNQWSEEERLKKI